MKQKPSIQFYVQDFLGSIDVQMMSAEEVGVYCLLLFNCFNNGGTLPSDPKGLARICRGAQPTELVLKKFYAEGEFLRNNRIDFEIKKQKKFSKKMRDVANNRWKPRNAKALSRQSSSSSTSTSNNPLPPKGGKLPKGDGAQRPQKQEMEIQAPSAQVTAMAKILKWFWELKLKNPNAKASMYVQKFSPEIVLKALKSQNCKGLKSFESICEQLTDQKRKDDKAMS